MLEAPAGERYLARPFRAELDRRTVLTTEIRPYRPTVRTLPFQGSDTGSNPVRVTNESRADWSKGRFARDYFWASEAPSGLTRPFDPTLGNDKRRKN